MNEYLIFWSVILSLEPIIYYAFIKPLITRLFYHNKIIVGMKAHDPAFVINHFMKHPLIILGAIFDWIVILLDIPLPDSIISGLLFWLSFACTIYLIYLPFLYAETIPKELEE